MNTLSTLKLVQSKRPSELSPVVVRRTKLMKQLWQQIELVKAQQQGQTFHATRYRTIVDADTGISRSVEIPKRVKAWWWTLDSGKICLAVRYGAKQLEIAKGKNAVEVATVDELIAVMEKIKIAVDLGELDQQIEAASGALRVGFKR
jgi:hypothetical protein